MTDASRRHRRPARAAASRRPSWALRQLRHPVQGVRPARACRATRTRRSPTPRQVHRLHRRRADRGAAHPVGPGRRLRARWPRTPPTAGVGLGTINSNVFQDDDYKLGSRHQPGPAGAPQGDSTTCSSASTSWTPPARRDLKLWFSDGTNYPGQDDIRARQDRLAEALREVYDRLGDDQRMLLEYKLFEPAFYTTDVPDWGTVLRALPGARARRRRSCVDTGHHAPGTNIEFIVAFLLRAGTARRVRLQLPLLRRRRPDGRRGRPVPAVPDHARGRRGGGARRRTRASPSCSTSATTSSRRSRPSSARCMNVQEATAKALLVDADALAAAQRAGDVLGANAVLMDAYNTDVRPLLRRAARGAWASTPTRSRPTAAPATRSGSPPSASAARRPAGARDATPTRHDRSRRELHRRASQPARRRPAQHQLRRRQHLGQGHRHRPGHRRGRSSCCGSRAPAATSAR